MHPHVKLFRIKRALRNNGTQRTSTWKCSVPRDQSAVSAAIGTLHMARRVQIDSANGRAGLCGLCGSNFELDQVCGAQCASVLLPLSVVMRCDCSCAVATNRFFCWCTFATCFPLLRGTCVTSLTTSIWPSFSRSSLVQTTVIYGNRFF